MKVVIIEDESLSAQRLEKMISEYDPNVEVIAQLSSVAKSVRFFEEHHGSNAPDLVFMDIHLEDDNAFRILEKSPFTTPVIFTTAFDQYMLKAFKVNSVDYLLKPIDADELHAALDKFRNVHVKKNRPASDVDKLIALLQNQQQEFKERFMVTIGTRIVSVAVTDIAYFYYQDKSVWLTTSQGLHMAIEYSLDKLVTLVDPKKFFRVNRAFLIAIHSIRTIHSYSGSKIKVDVAPVAKQDIFVSLDRLTDFKEWLGR